MKEKEKEKKEVDLVELLTRVREERKTRDKIKRELNLSNSPPPDRASSVEEQKRRALRDEYAPTGRQGVPRYRRGRRRQTILERVSDLMDADARTRTRGREPSAIERFLGIDENTKINWFGDE